MTNKDRNGRSNIVELLGLLVATIGLFVTLSDKLHTGKSSVRPPVEQQERHEAPQRVRPNYEDRRNPERDMPKSFKRPDRLMPSKEHERLPRN